MAHTKAKGTSKLGRDSRAQRLGVKIFGNQKVKAGEIIVRQRGTKYTPGSNVLKGGDDTLYAKKTGQVIFCKKRSAHFTGRRVEKTMVSLKV